MTVPRGLALDRKGRQFMEARFLGTYKIMICSRLIAVGVIQSFVVVAEFLRQIHINPWILYYDHWLSFN